MYTRDRESLFGPEDDTRVPGEVIIKLSAHAADAVESIPIGPGRLIQGVLPTQVGISDLDSMLIELGCTGVTLVYPMEEPLTDLVMAAGMEVRPKPTIVAHISKDVDPSEASAMLRASREVEAAEPNRFRTAQAMTPNDPMFQFEWGLSRIRAPEAWLSQMGDPSVVVAVIDSGVDLDHPDLVGNLVSGQDLVDIVEVSPAAGFHFEGDVLTRDDVPEDEVGHGTHVAGTIASVTDNGLGVAGVSWFSKIMPVRVLAKVVRDSDGYVTATGTAVDIAAGIRWATSNGAKVINLSLGSYGTTFVEREAVAYAALRDVVVVAAMGNDATTKPMYPAAYPGVLAVGAIDRDNKRASFSNIGAHIGVCAPGVEIRSTYLNGGFEDLEGTSMAAPHVAGVAALVRSAKPDLSAAAVQDRLRVTAQALRDTDSDDVPNIMYGSGLVDAAAAVSP